MYNITVVYKIPILCIYSKHVTRSFIAYDNWIFNLDVPARCTPSLILVSPHTRVSVCYLFIITLSGSDGTGWSRPSWGLPSPASTRTKGSTSYHGSWTAGTGPLLFGKELCNIFYATFYNRPLIHTYLWCSQQILSVLLVFILFYTARRSYKRDRSRWGAW